MSILTKATVLVLNRDWQAINVRTPQEAFCMMATNVATEHGLGGHGRHAPQLLQNEFTITLGYSHNSSTLLTTTQVKPLDAK
jgi:hypothetical protein